MPRPSWRPQGGWDLSVLPGSPQHLTVCDEGGSGPTPVTLPEALSWHRSYAWPMRRASWTDPEMTVPNASTSTKSAGMGRQRANGVLGPSSGVTEARLCYPQRSAQGLSSRRPRRWLPWPSSPCWLSPLSLSHLPKDAFWAPSSKDLKLPQHLCCRNSSQENSPSS